jgi:tetratricopeptide (TPR) repeat protein
MADDLLDGILGGEDEKPEVEAPQALAGAEAFAAATAAIESRQDPRVARETARFLREQTRLLETQRHHLDDEHALRLAQLTHQRHLLRGQRIGQAIRLAFQVVIALVVIVIGIGIAVMLRDAFTSRSVVIDEFDAPAALAARGVTGTVLAGDILDGLTRLQDATASIASAQQIKRDLSNGWSDQVKVAVPETGISLGEISRLLTARFGHDTHIGGDLIQTDSGGLALTVRGDHVTPRTFSGTAADVDTLVTNAAEYLYSQFQPTLWATYLYDTRRCPEAIDFARAAYNSADDDSRASLLTTWAVCLDLNTSRPQALQLVREAIRLRPDYWPAYLALISSIVDEPDFEGAWREGQTLIQAAGGNPGRAPASAFLVLDDLVEDLQAQINGMVADVKTNGGSGASTPLNERLQIARAQALQHDPTAAELTLQTATVDAQSSPRQLAFLHLTRGLLADEAGNNAGAAKELEAATEASAGSLRAFLDEVGACQLAVAADATGNKDQADAVIASGSRIPDCQRFRGDILDYRGDWAGAQQAYAQAVAIAPDLPAGYYSWAVGLARHGDLTGAIAKFEAANQHGPHWADPLKAWGDVLLKQGHPEQALAKYDEALKYAPNWAALKQARDAGANHGR